MNILLVEDRGSVSHYLARVLEEEGYTVFRAYGITDAQSYWASGDMECIILDLNMSPEGLRPEETAATRDGILSGWVWFDRYVLPGHDEMRERTIIYSEYTRELRDNVPESAGMGIHIVAKRGSSSTAREVLALVKRIARRVEGRAR